ncbi:MAG: ATP-dependent RecD-like DNA helicase [Flavobacteriales bacterium]
MNSSRTEHIAQLFRSSLRIEPTVDQQLFMDRFSHFLCGSERYRIFILKGYAGTGKTTMMGELVRFLPMLKMNTELLAPTGRAAKVLSGHTGQRAYTIHKKIYMLRNKAGYSSFELAHNPHSNTLFIIDEASMIGSGSSSNQDGFRSRDLLEDVLRYIYRGKNCFALIVGDPAQLPPVGMADSPALSEEFIRDNFRLDVHSIELKQVVRQASDSGILYNATRLREQLSANANGFPKIETEGRSDVRQITGTELQDELEWAFGQYGAEGVRIITRSNKRANLFNMQVRNRVFWIENELNGGDELMAVKNNYFWLPADSPAGFIANGDSLTVQKVKAIREYHELRFADVEVKLSDYPDLPEVEMRILIDTLQTEGPHLPAEKLKSLFEAISEDYSDEPDQKLRKEKIMNDPWYNALQVKFAWSVTCHKAQGGQWPVVFVDQGYLTEEMIDREYLRWLYTAFTRASYRLYLINFSEKFF